MAKREFIERGNLLNELTESSKHHAQTSREESLLYRDRQIVREQHTITEQEIVKPYLDKIRAEIVKKHLSVIEKNDFESGRTYGYEEALDIIDKYTNDKCDKGCDFCEHTSECMPSKEEEGQE